MQHGWRRRRSIRWSQSIREILADMGISPRTVAFLHTLGHDAVHLSDQGLEMRACIVLRWYYCRRDWISPTLYAML